MAADGRNVPRLAFHDWTHWANDSIVPGSAENERPRIKASSATACRSDDWAGSRQEALDGFAFVQELNPYCDWDTICKLPGVSSGSRVVLAKSSQPTSLCLSRV